MALVDHDLLHVSKDSVRFAKNKLSFSNVQNNKRKEFSCLLNADEMLEMVASGLSRLRITQVRSRIGLFSSSLWSNEYVSLRDLHNYSEVFGEISGEILVKDFGGNPIITKYYTSSRVFHQNGSLGLRGSRYYVCVDERLSIRSRVSIMVEELYLSISTLEKIDRTKLDTHDLLPYLGILDNAKQHAVTLFNSFIYRERRYGVPTDPEYLQVRSILFDVAANLTRSYYEAALGRSFTALVTVDRVSELDRYFRLYSNRVEHLGLKIQELDHPLKILLTAYNLSKHSSIETVIGFPSGSTQLSIVVAMVNEVINKKRPRLINVICLPISHHSGIEKIGVEPISDEDLFESASLFKEFLTDKNVLIVDDNSSTGSTISRAIDVVSKFMPHSVAAGVAEMDLQRIMIRAKIAFEKQTKMLSVNLNHSTFDSAIGINPVSIHDKQLRKIYAIKVLGIKEI